MDMAKENENKVALNGIYVFSEMNSEGIYIATYDLSKLKQNQIEELRHRLEDLYARIDKEYTQADTRMRSFHIKWVSQYEYGADGKKHKVEMPVLSFYVVPSRVVNMFKNARRIYYELLHKHTIKIPISSAGVGALLDEEGYHSRYITEKNLYLLPIGKVSEFEHDFEEIRNIYRDIHEKVRDFAYSDYLYELNEILSDYGLQTLTPNMIVRRQPVADYGISGTEIDMNMLSRVDPNIRQKIEKKTEKFVKRAVKGLQREITPILKEIRENLMAWVEGKGKGKRMAVLENIDIVQDKLDAMGLGRIEALDGIKNLLSGEEPITEDDAPIIHKLADEVSGRVLSIGKEIETKEKKKAKMKKAISEIDNRGVGIGL